MGGLGGFGPCCTGQSPFPGHLIWLFWPPAPVASRRVSSEAGLEVRAARGFANGWVLEVASAGSIARSSWSTARSAANSPPDVARECSNTERTTGSKTLRCYWWREGEETGERYEGPSYDIFQYHRQPQTQRHLQPQTKSNTTSYRASYTIIFCQTQRQSQRQS